MEKIEDISSDFIICIQKLLSSISTLHKYLFNINTSIYNQESFNKLKTIKDAITSLAPAVKTAKQLDPTSTFIKHLSNEYLYLCNDYKKYYYLTMVNIPSFMEYKQHINCLNVWLPSINANIHDVLQSNNKQQALLIIKNVDELNKYESILERATILNQTMTTDLPDEQTKELVNEILDIKEQWQILLKDLNTLKERYLSSESINSIILPISNHRENENLIDYFKNCLKKGKQLIKQQEQINSNTLSDNNNLLIEIKKCEEELCDLKTLLNHMITDEIIHSSVDELTILVTSIINARIQLENRIEQQHGFIKELDTFNNWLKKFTDESKILDNQTIQLVLNERQEYFNELTKHNQENNSEIQEKIQNLISMWMNLSPINIDSRNIVTTQSSPIVPLLSSSCIDQYQQNIIEQAKELLNTIVQLGNRQEIEQLKNRIKTFLTHYKNSQISNSNAILSDKIYNELANRQLILQQMLIDTSHIDRLRVNFVLHFNTENNFLTATNEITTLIDNYPKEMTNNIRQWLNDQQRTHAFVPLTNIDISKTINDFEEYLKEFQLLIHQYQDNDNNHMKLKKLIQQLENQSNLLEKNLNNDDKQRVEHLQQHYLQIKKQYEDIQKKNLAIKTNINHNINNINTLITHIKDIEEQIKTNTKQPFNDYEKLISDCQRIINELEQNLRLQVEHAINTGKRLYTPDNKDMSGVESADETGGCSSSSTPSPSLKKHSDLTLRKVRRHVLQLTQHWKNANNNIQSRLKILQRTQTAVEELRRKCDQLHAHLLEIELIYAHKPQIKALNTEQVPTEIEQAKHLLSTLMLCKTAIDDIQQSAQNVENEYNIHVTNHAQELNQRWEHSITSITQRIQSLQDSIKNTENDIYSSSVEYPWQRTTTMNKIPYYINHSDQTTSWNHPKMLELMHSFSKFNDIRFSAYRTAMKLRTLQKCLCLDLISLNDIINVFEENEIIDSLNKNINITEILDYLKKIYEKTSNEYPQLINIILTTDLTLNWLLNIYDINQTGSIRLISMKMALALLCRGNIEEKYRYIFSLATYENDDRNVLDRQRLSILFQQAIVIPKQLGEIAAFGGSSVEPSVQSCFEYAHNPDVITTDNFLDWVKLEPQSLVWLPVMHRLAASEAAKHEARCNICKIYPILGFRYRSLKYFNCDICQNCFFSGKQTKIFKMDHPLQEYYTETTSSEDIRDFFRIFKNKLWAKHRKNPKLGYLPLPHVFDNTITTNEQQTLSSSPIIVSSLTTPLKSEIENTQPIFSSNASDDEHGIIAQHCKNLNNATYKSPRAIAHELLTHSNSFDNDQRNELEAIIHDLEDENRLLQNEYERLCQEHMEKSLIINEHQEQLKLNDNQLDIYNNCEILHEAKLLRQYKIKLEQRMKILEEHNKQLGKQLKRSKQLLLRESPSHNLRRSIDRNLERQSNLLTIDNLFHMADDINRAVGDLVSVITEPQSTTSSNFYQQIVTS